MGREQSEYELYQLNKAFNRCVINKKRVLVETCNGIFEFIPFPFSHSTVYVKRHGLIPTTKKISPCCALWGILWALWAGL